MKVNLILNGRKRTFDVNPNEYLLETLRNHHITSVKRGCDASTCGVCTVLIDQKPMMSCSFLSVRAEGKQITTVEGIQDEVERISTFFGQEGADQCGFCNTGLALTIYSMKQHLSNPTDDQLKSYLVGNLCRCSGYEAQLKAIKQYIGEHK